MSDSGSYSTISEQEWKMEPLSPFFDTDKDAWLLFENETDEVNLVKGEVGSPAVSRAATAQQLLEDIAQLVKVEDGK